MDATIESLKNISKWIAAGQRAQELSNDYLATFNSDDMDGMQSATYIKMNCNLSWMQQCLISCSTAEEANAKLLDLWKTASMKRKPLLQPIVPNIEQAILETFGVDIK